ncbi:MAG: potassium transporter [Spirochaetales bacterium]|nr:potassium transporter [Spirochaetales bacterium]
MMNIKRSEKLILFSYFIIVIIIGTILLQLPFAWKSENKLDFIDAFFTATSATCVTGLITVDTAVYSLFGKIVILLLIQAGGLGIISFTTMYLALPSKRISLKSTKVIREYYLVSVETEPKHIIKQIILITLLIEIIGAALLYIGFMGTVKDHPILFSVFHAVSAFCNAGFSLFSNNLEGYVRTPFINITIMLLIILGGFGFVALRDIAKRAARKKKKLTVHSKIMIGCTLTLIISAALLFFIFEYNNAYKELSMSEKIMASLFQSITPRTAGFDTVPQSSLSASSKFITLPLMFIGGGSGSAAGGIKVTTFFIVIIAVLRRTRRRGSLVIFKKELGSAKVLSAIMLFIKALLIVSLCILLLTITELSLHPAPDKDFYKIVFESFSAFGTVGLSLGITPSLSLLGKIVVICTMFAGRVGLISMAMPQPIDSADHLIEYPKGEVLLG